MATGLRSHSWLATEPRLEPAIQTAAILDELECLANGNDQRSTWEVLNASSPSVHFPKCLSFGIYTSKLEAEPTSLPLIWNDSDTHFRGSISKWKPAANPNRTG